MYNFEELLDLREKELAGIRHSLGNNMSVIKSASQIIKMRNPDVTKDPMWEMLERNFDNIIHFLDELKVYRQSIDISRQNTTMQEFLEAFEKSTDHSTQVECVGDLSSSINVDTSALILAFKRILDNFADMQKKVYVKACVDSNNKELIVSFSGGKAFDAIELERSLEPFYSSKKDHIGLGLCIARNIIKAHDGDINLSNENDRSKITVTIPLL